MLAARRTLATLVVLALAGGAAPAAAQEPLVYEDAGSVILSGPSAGDIAARGETALFLDGVQHDGEIHVGGGASLHAISASSVTTLRVTGTGAVDAPSRLQVVRIIAGDDAVVGGAAVDVVLPPMPEFQSAEEEIAWFEWRFEQPPFLELSGSADVTIRSVTDDRLGAQTLLTDSARLEVLEFSDYIEMELYDDALLVARDIHGGGELYGRSRVEITEGIRWGGFRLHDDASIFVRNAGASTGAFSTRLSDRASATIENMIDGALWNEGTGLLRVTDSMPAPGLDYQREVRIFLEHPQARLELERYGGPWSLNAPVCGANCNPVYFVIGNGASVKAVDSTFLMELGVVRFLELRDSQAITAYAQTTTPTVRGECALLVGSSAANLVYERQCSRIRVTALDGMDRVVGATVTLLDVNGDPVPVYDQATGEEAATRVTDAQGLAVFDLAPRATPLQVRVEAPDYERTADVIAVQAEHDVVVR